MIWADFIFILKSRVLQLSIIYGQTTDPLDLFAHDLYLHMNMTMGSFTEEDHRFFVCD